MLGVVAEITCMTGSDAMLGTGYGGRQLIDVQTVPCLVGMMSAFVSAPTKL
jgi:hypothetical protein